MEKKKIILGSSSKFRKSLMSELNMNFECISPDIDETRLFEEKAENMVIRLAIKKARKICGLTDNSLIISSDACASCEGRILGKPLYKNIAIEYLEYISEKTIIFHTGLCVMDSDNMEHKTDIAKEVKKDVPKCIDTKLREILG